jgi:tRNA(Ile)-lysidine synthase
MVINFVFISASAGDLYCYIEKHLTHGRILHPESKLVTPNYREIRGFMADLNPGLIAHHIRQALGSFLSGICEPGDRVVLAVSGGADSLALAAATSALLKDFSLSATAVVVDHQLQDKSEEVALAAAAKCRGLGIADARVVQVEVVPGAGLEADARTARYQALQEVAAEVGAKGILLAHSLNDQAETVILRLARGSGTRSLGAMRTITPITGGVPLWRPLLGVPREHLELSLAEYALEAYQDQHNQDENFLRVAVRKKIMPVLREVLGESVDLALTRTAFLSQMDADALDAVAATAWNSCQDGQDLKTAEVGALHMAIQTRIIRSWLVQQGANSAALTLEHVMAIHRLMTDPRVSGPVNVAGGLEVRRESGRLRT